MFVAYYEATQSILLYDIESRRIRYNIKLGNEDSLAPIRFMTVLLTSHKATDVMKILVSRLDCRIDYFNTVVPVIFCSTDFHSHYSVYSNFKTNF